RNNKKEFLYVNPETFSTGIAIWDEATFKKKPIPDVQKTPFAKALEKYDSVPITLQNHGLKKAEAEKDGFFLTVDLCPSKKRLDKKIFTRAMKLSRNGEPVPIGIAVSGEWIKKHGEEFKWLAKERKLRITWINHSYTHPYSKDLPLKENFLLSQGVDFEREVLETEKLLLENGITPSPFFRFPGLVSNSGLAEKLKRLSLIPIGAQSWLAKKETPEKGGIILVHGNGNEPKGIKKLMAFYKENETAFKKGRLEFFSIEEAFEGK
ncbi:MAG: polysaccharide deacetylase, partial [Deltaproteobacteria bacterium]